MPSRDDEYSAGRRLRKEDDSPRAKAKERSKTEKKYSRRQASPERPKSRARRDSLNSGIQTRASMVDLGSKQKNAPMSAVPEMSRRASVGEAKPASYPAFSKEHSREAVRPAQEATKSRTSAPTPGSTEHFRPERSRHNRTPGPGDPSRAAPSSPSAVDEGKPGVASGSRQAPEERRRDSPRQRADSDRYPRTSNLRTAQKSSPRGTSQGDASDSSGHAMGTAKNKPGTSPSENMTYAEPNKAQASTSPHQGPTARTSEGSQVTASSDSQATSVAPVRRISPITGRDSYETTPTRIKQPELPQQTTPALSSAIPQHVGGIPFRSFSQPQPNTNASTPSFGHRDDLRSGVVPPPPPPPPMDVPDETPRVDYLLLNGGLGHIIPRTLLPVTVSPSPQGLPRHGLPLQGNEAASRVFHSITGRLDDLNKVLSKNGSVAVATGYRSVARRLLDRLENVFARNISSEKCFCAVCNSTPGPELSLEEQDGISWGEILEFVSGRRELPQWPPFTLATEGKGLGITERVDAPMQKLDPDVPDEYRQHYMRQNDKTKRSVQSWLDSQLLDSAQAERPQDVDDETLSFAMLTRLEADKRPYFTALIKGLPSIPTARSPSPSVVGGEMENTVLDKTGLALQRLYRLNNRPRRPECTIYLINNPHLHGMLATLAAVSPTEWDILVSGRFDGFLWSGAETGIGNEQSFGDSSRPVTRGPTPLSRTTNSRSTTPFSPAGRSFASPVQHGSSRGATPFSSAGSTAGGISGAGGPVQHDEETEVAVLGELERAIYRDMEQLEDAFEAVHRAAELMRGRLRARAAGLLMAAQARRGSSASELGARLGTPGSTWGFSAASNAVLDDEGAFDDGRSELAPDDSASNISFARIRRGKERRTPGLDEDGGTAADRRRRR